jgi:hypothetical protein
MNQVVIEQHRFVSIMIPHLILVFVGANKPSMELSVLHSNNRFEIKAILFVD